MLVIRRHPGESIRIGMDIELEIIECGHNRVKLGIRAPQHVPVMRSEILETRAQNLEAAGAMPRLSAKVRSGDGCRPAPLVGDTR